MAETDASASRDALVERLFGATLGAMDVVSVYIGVRLGLYRALADRGSSSSEELAETTGLNERYVREWLEQQATTGVLEVDDERRYTLPPGHDEALLDETSLNYIAPVGKFFVACVRPIDAVLAAYRSGDGVAYADYGADLHEGQAEFTRPMFEHLLGSEWLPAIPEVHARLQADPPARVADVACGQGFSTMAIARAYPNALVDGIDLDEASIEAAKDHLAGPGSRTGSASSAETPLTRASRAGTTSSTCTSRSTTCPIRSTSCARAVASLLREGRSSSATSGSGMRSRRAGTTSSASTTGSASCTACLWAWSAKARPEPAR